MTRYVALLRGINVGGNHKVEMKRLKQLFESLGCTDVTTYINSGNVVFTTSKKESALAKEIEKAIKKEFGFEVPTLVRSSANIQKIAKGINPKWTNDTKQRTDVLFLWDEFDSKLTLKLITVNKDVDRLVYLDGAIVWNLDKVNYSKTSMKKFIGTKVYKGMTARNINTVRKLAEMMK